MGAFVVATPCLDGSGRFHQDSSCGVGRESGVRERDEINILLVLQFFTQVYCKATVGYIVKEGLKLNLVSKTSGLTPSCYIGSRRGRGLVG
jgi:hypothetical protein